MKGDTHRLVALKRGWLRETIGALRVPQWSKNMLIFVPCVITQSFDTASFVAASSAFVAFSLVASATYVFNDLRDLSSDRLHDYKRDRAFADRRLSDRSGYLIIAVLLLLAGIVLTQMPPEFALVLALYAACSVAYTVVLKRLLGIDVVAIACLYVLRVVAGDEAIGAQFAGIDSSSWILGFSVLFFLSLAIVKRCSELSLMSGGPESQMHGRAYKTEDYPVMLSFAAASGLAAIVILMLYIGSADVADNFSRAQILWTLVPILAYWLLRMILLANRGEIREDPVLFTLRDNDSLICGFAVLLVSALAW